jgi:hypothetical protein
VLSDGLLAFIDRAVSVTYCSHLEKYSPLNYTVALVLRSVWNLYQPLHISQALALVKKVHLLRDRLLEDCIYGLISA